MINLKFNESYDKEGLANIVEKGGVPSDSISITIIIIAIIGVLLLSAIMITVGVKAEMPSLISAAAGITILIGFFSSLLIVDKSTPKAELAKGNVNLIIKEMNDSNYDKVVLVDKKEDVDIYINNYLYITYEGAKSGDLSNIAVDKDKSY